MATKKSTEKTRTPRASKRSDPLENPQISLSDPRAYALLFGDSMRSAAGVDVNESTALQVPAVWAAVNFMSSTIASLPLGVYKRDGDDREPDKGNRLYRLLHDAPNEAWSSYRWRKYSMNRAMLYGRAITLIIRNAARTAINKLVPANPADVEIKVRNGETIYRVRSLKQDFAAADVIDIPWMLGADGISHIDPVHKMRNTIGEALAIVEYGSNFFSNGGIPPLVLEGPLTSPGAVARAKSDISAAMRKTMAEGDKVLVMPLGHTLKAVGIDPEKMQMTETQRWLLEEVARWAGMSPIFLQDLSRGTFSNTEQAGIHIVKFSLMDWVRNWEDEFNLKIFGWENEDRFVAFNVDGLERGDFASRTAAYGQSIQNAIRTPNEIRRLENLPAQDQQGADSLLIQGATVELGTQAGSAEGANNAL